MDRTSYFFAVDLGATSGRTILGSINRGTFQLEEVTRFANNLIRQGGHFYWDIYALYFEILRGLKEVAQRGLEIASIAVDTWGVDFVCIGQDNAILRNPRAYRDEGEKRYLRVIKMCNTWSDSMNDLSLLFYHGKIFSKPVPRGLLL